MQIEYSRTVLIGQGRSQPIGGNMIPGTSLYLAQKAKTQCGKIGSPVYMFSLIGSMFEKPL